MSEALYERYKEALRQGHIASLRGRHEAAVAAYRVAAELAPDRALPQTSLGTAYLRLGRFDEALAAFDAALGRAAGDQAALAGRADALVALGRRADAAATLDRLADVQDRAGQLGDACDTTRRALELAEGRARRRTLTALVGRLREQSGDGEPSEAVARALRVLDTAALDAPAPGAGGREPLATEDAAAAAVAHVVVTEPAPEPPPDPLALVSAAESALDRGDAAAAAALLRDAAAAHRRLGEATAALDAAVRALALDPLAPGVHLALAELYLDRGWRSLAADKLVLLARLAALAGDDETHAAVRALASRHLADNERLRALTA